MFDRQLICIGLLASSLLSFVVGCGPADAFPVYPVRGVVYLGDEPMQGGGGITLVPLAAGPGKAAGGIIADDGSYELTTYQEGDGARPGEFRVVITQQAMREAELVSGGTEQETGMIATVERSKIIPRIYSDFQKSPLTLTVKEIPLNEADFRLDRK